MNTLRGWATTVPHEKMNPTHTVINIRDNHARGIDVGQWIEDVGS